MVNLNIAADRQMFRQILVTSAIKQESTKVAL